MALNIYSTLPMSDEPERVFSEGGNLLVLRRRQLLGDHVQEILCLKSWQGSGLITLDGALFDQVIRVVDSVLINDEIATVALNNSDDDEDDEVV
jgi:hypothetical protein